MSREIKLIEVSSNSAGDITIKIPRSYLRHAVVMHDNLPEGSRVTNTKVFSDAVVRQVRALEWYDCSNGTSHDSDCQYEIEPQGKLWRLIRAVTGGTSYLVTCNSRDAAKDAAQADFERRIRAALTPAPQPAGEAGPQPDRLLKDALFASIEPTHQSPLYCGVAVTAMTQACAAVFYVPRDWSRDQIKAWLGNPQGFAHPPQPSVTVAEAAGLADAIEACDWSGNPIGNKMILRAAVKALRALKGGA